MKQVLEKKIGRETQLMGNQLLRKTDELLATWRIIYSISQTTLLQSVHEELQGAASQLQTELKVTSVQAALHHCSSPTGSEHDGQSQVLLTSPPRAPMSHRGKQWTRLRGSPGSPVRNKGTCVQETSYSTHRRCLSQRQATHHGYEILVSFSALTLLSLPCLAPGSSIPQGAASLPEIYTCFESHYLFGNSLKERADVWAKLGNVRERWSPQVPQFQYLALAKPGKGAP